MEGLLVIVHFKIGKDPELTDADKGCMLVEAMADTKARQRAEAALAHTSSYDEAMDSLRKHYEDNQLMFRYHYNELHQADSIKDSVKELDRLEHRLKSSIRGLEASHGFTASQVCGSCS